MVIIIAIASINILNIVLFTVNGAYWLYPYNNNMIIYIYNNITNSINEI